MMNILLIAMAVVGLGAGLAPVYAVANDSLVGLPDPTRPSSASGDGVATGVHGLVLQSVLIAPQRRVAVINGKTLAVGERIGDVTVAAIRPHEVVVKRASGEFTLRLCRAMYRATPMPHPNQRISPMPTYPLELKLPLQRCLLLLTFVLLSACGMTNPYRWSSDMNKDIDREIEKTGKTDAKAAVPAEVSQALLPGLGTRQAEGRSGPLETRFDLSVSNAPARQVFLSLVEGTPYSIVLHPDVSGQVSLQLKGVTVPEALETLRRMYGYHFRREANRYFILGGGMQTRIFPVNYLTMNRRGKSDTRVTSGIQSSGSSVVVVLADRFQPRAARPRRRDAEFDQQYSCRN